MPFKTFSTLLGVFLVGSTGLVAAMPALSTNVTRRDPNIGVAEIIWFSEPDCDPSKGTFSSPLIVPDLIDQVGIDPDECDPGRPPIGTEGNFQDVPFAPASFLVGPTDGTCSGDDPNYLGAVTLYPSCTRQLAGVDEQDPVYFCPGECEQLGWSHDNGYGCTNIPDYPAHENGPDYAIFRHVTTCADGQTQ